MDPKSQNNWNKFEFTNPSSNPKEQTEEIEILELEEPPKEETNNKEEIITPKKKVNKNTYKNAYLGENKKTIQKEIISIPTFLFGPFYFLYRKLWFFGIFILILYIYSYLYIPESAGILIRVAFQFLLALIFPKIYPSIVERKIEQIEKNNPTKEEEEKIELCKKKGNPLKLRWIGVILVIYVGLIALLIKQNDTEEIKEEEKTYQKQIEELSYKIPTYLTEKTDFDNYQFYVDHTHEEGICYIKVSTSHSYITEEEYNKEMNTFHDSYKEYKQEQVKIGTLEWTKHYSSSSLYHLNIYTMIKNNILYEFSFESRDSKKNICSFNENYILNTIE